LSEFEAVVGANVVDVPYWLDADRFALESLREGIERFARVSDLMEITTTRSGAMYMSASKGAVSLLGDGVSGVESVAGGCRRVRRTRAESPLVFRRV
jgi:hypothetical protein